MRGEEPMTEGGGIILSTSDYGCAWQGGPPNQPLGRERVRAALESGSTWPCSVSSAVIPGRPGLRGVTTAGGLKRAPFPRRASPGRPYRAQSSVSAVSIPPGGGGGPAHCRWAGRSETRTDVPDIDLADLPDGRTVSRSMRRSSTARANGYSASKRAP